MSLPKKTSELVEIPDNLARHPGFLAAWAQWISYRVEIRKAMKATTMRFQLKRLAEWGPERAMKAIDYSIYQGYTGIFEEQTRHSQLDVTSKPVVREEIPIEEEF